ncbi:MAG: VanZ family protein [Planctomycetota bacterium]|nr:VanZ family protein [Planctomycetaceae bacterium]MDQ3332133.1 VanZ family protein [Planctomycetota bacterium]
MRSAKRAAPLLVVAWMLFIFGTSSTVVLPRQLFRFMRDRVLRDDGLSERFEVFWGLAWFAIVKSWHATEFALLFLFCFWALARWRPARRAANVTLAIAVALLFAAADEWHQTFVPGRGGNVIDVLIDSLGVLVASLAILSCGRPKVNPQ